MRTLTILSILSAVVGFCPLLASEPIDRNQEHVSFVDDIQPILKRNCDRCHGSKNQEGDLQLNDRTRVLDHDGLINRNAPSKSLLIKRLINEDEGDIMPLDGQRLSDQEVRLIRRWIQQGADWPDSVASPNHWAYQPIRRPTVPVVRSDATAVDQFVLEKLQARGLSPSPILDRPRLIRRLSLALTGVPPTPEEVEAFVVDGSPIAYERVVDRLLRSPRYGERWAVPWLDLARYADSNGFQADQIRDNWAYRDWIIRSFNEGLPFDQFVIDQLAGDLQPNATVDQKIATGFHRMTTCNVEAGVHPEANRVNQIVDRVNTTATVFMGTTLECAQCHDHKYDPFTQKDYYRLFAYFNNTPLEVKNTSGVTWDFYGPKMDLPMQSEQRSEYDQLTSEIADLEQERKSVVKASNSDFAKWLTNVQAIAESPDPDWQNVVPSKFESTGKEKYEIQPDGAVLLTGEVPDRVEHFFTFSANEQLEGKQITAVRVDLLTDDSIPGKGPGRGDPKRSNVILSELTCDLLEDGKTQRMVLRDARADFSQGNWDVSQAIDGDPKKGWAFSPQFGKPHWASFVLDQPLTLTEGRELRVGLGQFYGRGRVAGKPRISVFFGDPLVLSIDDATKKLAGKKELTNKERRTLRETFDKNNPRLALIDSKLKSAKSKRDSVQPDTTLVMVEMEEPRETFVMLRGDYENTADQVQPGVPAILPQPDRDVKTGNRLELARWLTSPKNPLLARVTVNRWWSEIFGTGLVSTPEDFGTQSESPSHPQLLDWLASELIDSGWSMKHVHKLMVMSAAFGQVSRITPELKQRDPMNRLLARGPRFRLPAESIRDNALAISGLLSDKMFGPPVMPFQPDKIWRSVGRNQPKWVAAKSEDRFRRGVYVVCKRAAPYPSFINFDAPDRGACTVNRARTNTPLQALTLLNDPAYAEMALAMADRVLCESPDETDVSRLAYAIQLAVSRAPADFEINVLSGLLSEERRRLSEDKKLVAQRTQVPFDAMKPRFGDPLELAAWFAVANAILNLDETMSQ